VESERGEKINTSSIAIRTKVISSTTLLLPSGKFLLVRHLVEADEVNRS